MSKRKPDTITERDGYRLEWFSRRPEIDCNVYKGDVLIIELGYPKFKATIQYVAELFTPEAVGMAKDKEAEDGAS